MTLAEVASTTPTNEQLTWELLGAYEATGTYDRWCRLFELAPGTAEADRSYETAHRAYASLWMAMGDAFHARLWPIALRWMGRAELAKHARA